MKTSQKPTEEILELSKIEIVSNTRTTFNPTEIEELATSIKSNGLLQPIGVLKNGNNYRLIFGERRYRAHLLNKSKTITCKVFHDLTEQQTKELQIIENLQRKDIHPMDEAKAFQFIIDTQDTTYKHVANKVGKSPSFIAQRLKLNDLIDEFQTAFRADRLTISLALEIAVLSQDIQKEVWENECSDIDIDDKIEIDYLDNYTCNLKNAPFNIKSKKLIPSAGACTDCAFNSACQSLLFPDEAKNPTCLKVSCFNEKSKIAFNNGVKEALQEPGTVLINSSYGHLSDLAKELEKQGHKILSRYDYVKFEEPEIPLEDTYKEGLEDGSYDSEEEMQEAYNEAVEEYETELKQYNELKASGKVIRAYAVCGGDKGQFFDVVLQDKKSISNCGIKPSAKALQEKMKSETVTAEDYKAEIERLYDSETRKKELDEEKTTPLFYEALKADTFFTMRPDAFEKEELCTMILLMKEFGGFWRNEDLIEGMFNDDLSDLEQFQSLLSKDMEDLNKMFLRLCRCVMLLKLKPHDKSRPSKDFKAQALLQLGNTYVPTQIDAIWSAQMEERKIRENKLSQKILSLEAKILDTKQEQVA